MISKDKYRKLMNKSCPELVLNTPTAATGTGPGTGWISPHHQYGTTRQASAAKESSYSKRRSLRHRFFFCLTPVISLLKYKASALAIILTTYIYINSSYTSLNRLLKKKKE